jgi:hypothetical protein
MWSGFPRWKMPGRSWQSSASKIVWALDLYQSRIDSFQSLYWTQQDRFHRLGTVSGVFAEIAARLATSVLDRNKAEYLVGRVWPLPGAVGVRGLRFESGDHHQPKHEETGSMGDRRRFFKQAGLLATAPWSKALLLYGASTATEASPEASVTAPIAPEAGDVILENAEMKLVIGKNGLARSLVHKPTSQECLAQGTDVPVFTVTQYRPYDNELQLAFPAKSKSFTAAFVKHEADHLLVGFELVDYVATIRLRITDAYIAFNLEKLEYTGGDLFRPKQKTPIDETVFLQLPVRRRINFGEWLNVMWDDEVAVSVLGTDPYAKIDAEPCDHYHMFKAGTVDEVKTEGVGAALITTATKNLLARVAQVEEDFALPRGVESRRHKEYKHSYYELREVTPKDIDRHLEFAKRGGFRAVDVYYQAFAKTSGHYPWNDEYPNKMDDLKLVVHKIEAAGMIPGIHLHYNKAHKEDAYVSPVPDPRLNVCQLFTLAVPLDASAEIINVEENPRRCTLDDERRILKIESELITYENYTPEPPYRFIGCARGALNTHPASYNIGAKIALLDVDTWPAFVRFSQNTSIQEEVAERLAEIYRDAGFQWVYFDGAEDVPIPYWFTVSRSQWLVYRKLKPEPLFGEGACKSHFSWHMLTRGNAFDVFMPEVMKAATRAHPAAEAPRIARDFTSLNFGWVGYWAPSTKTIGTQPDMLEYVTSRAAAWDCPISLNGELDALEAHPRTADNLEVIKRWEDVRASNWLTVAHKQALRNLDQEHTLLINEKGDFELLPYDQIPNAAKGNNAASAFVFERHGRTHVVYWHTFGQARLDLPLRASRVCLFREIGKQADAQATSSGVRVPLAGRHYLECIELSRADVIRAFQQAEVVAG